MRIAFFADIHANLPALEAVIADAKARGVTHVVCLGDIVGYGPLPAETLACVRRVASATVMGNHDAAACGLLDTKLFNNFARETAERAALALTQEDKDWLKDLPYVLEGNGFACAHGGFVDPERFRYLETKQDALHCFTAMPDFPLLVVGHTHIPCLFVQDAPNQLVRKMPPTDISLRPGMRVIVNPGSVGFPRTDNLAADYAMYDTQTRRITFLSCAYDLAPYRLALVRNGYNPMNYWFLSPSARKRQTEQAYLNPVRVAEAPLGSGKTFRPKNSHGLRALPKTFWVLVLLFFCLAVVSLGVLWPMFTSATREMAELEVVQPTEPKLVPSFDDWELSPSTTVKMMRVSTELLVLIPETSPANYSLKSPLVEVPRGVDRLRLNFIVDGIKAAYGMRATFHFPDGSQRKDRLHDYKRPGAQSYTVVVPEGATHLRLHLDVDVDSRLQLGLPELSVIK